MHILIPMHSKIVNRVGSIHTFVLHKEEELETLT